MNRFRFRAWDKENNKMECNIDCRYDFSDYFEYPNYIVMQSTGLRDKNGKLIYEGDIVKVFHISSTGQPIEIIEEVCFDNKFASFKTKGYDKLGEVYMNRFDDDDVYEVIGNIYENKELFKEYE